MSYIISLGVGFVVGLFYWLLKVQSPAPPLIALAGLLGMVLGEQAIPMVRAQFFLTPSAESRAEAQPLQVLKPKKNAGGENSSAEKANPDK
jgi:XapX domain-containing protein